MDVSWIPGNADAVVVGIAGLAVVAGTIAAVVRGRGAPSAPPTPPEADRPSSVVAPPATAEPTAPPAAPPSPPAVGDRVGVGEQLVTPVDTSGSITESPEAPESRFARLRSRLGGSLATVFRRGVIDADAYDELEEALLLADVGAGATDEILAAVRARLVKDPTTDPHLALRDALVDIVDPAADRSLALGAPGDGGARSVIVVGVNGVGKTTTVGKIARLLIAERHSVVLGAADTFRAAAADQLETWGARVGVPVVRSEREGADPASVAFSAAQRAVEDATDVVLIDTAGRLQNKQGLMDELGKIVRVVGKVAAPSEVLLVLDATTGQNGLAQARVFSEVAGLTGIILTKLDGTAKGGIVIAVQRELGVPVKFVGLGEGADDLAPFDAVAFVNSLVGTGE